MAAGRRDRGVATIAPSQFMKYCSAERELEGALSGNPRWNAFSKRQIGRSGPYRIGHLLELAIIKVTPVSPWMILVCFIIQFIEILQSTTTPAFSGQDDMA